MGPAKDVLCDMLWEGLVDLRKMFVGLPFKGEVGSEERQAAAKEITPKLARYTSAIEKQLKASGGEFIMGSEISYVDFMGLEVFDWICEEIPDGESQLPEGI